jgi:hypothetical protein
MIYEIRYQYRLFSLLVPAMVQPWQRPYVKRTKYWWRVRLAAWLDSIHQLYPGYPPGASIGCQRRMRIRIVDERT